jgi:hypothetical protein
MQPTTVQAICCCGAVAAFVCRLCLDAAPAGINASASTVAVITGTIVFIAVFRFALFLDHAFQQRRPAFATAARPLKDRGEALAAFVRRDPRIVSHSRDRFQFLMA